MGNIRKKYDATLKAKIALEAVKGEKTIAEISSEYGVHSTQIAHWKKQLLEELPSIFSDNVPKAKKEEEELEAKQQKKCQRRVKKLTHLCRFKNDPPRPSTKHWLGGFYTAPSSLCPSSGNCSP